MAALRDAVTEFGLSVGDLPVLADRRKQAYPRTGMRPRTAATAHGASTSAVCHIAAFVPKQTQPSDPMPSDRRPTPPKWRTTTQPVSSCSTMPASHSPGLEPTSRCGGRCSRMRGGVCTVAASVGSESGRLLAATWDAISEPYEAANARSRQAEALLAAKAPGAAAILRQVYQTTVELGDVSLRQELERLTQRARIGLRPLSTKPPSATEACQTG